MKIEIDLNDILGDEYGTETLQESIRRQVLEKLTLEIKSGIAKKIDYEVAKTISETLKESINNLMPSAVKELMDSEYAPVSKYGERGPITTFRRQLIEGIHEQMTYKKTPYLNDRNVFTRAVDDSVSEIVGKFKSNFDAQVNQIFTAECMQHAKDALQKKLGIK